MPKLATDKYCTGCMACHDVCGHDAIKVVEKNRMPFVAVDSSRCVSCGRCERACPIVSPVEHNDLHDMTVYGGWAKDRTLRMLAASGGAFSGLARSFFKEHGEAGTAVVGAELRDNRVYHRMVEREEALHLIANSKYIQSDTAGIYRKVLGRLRQGCWVMFSGCPCHIAGLYGVLGGRRKYERLVTVEVVCHGIAGSEALDLHLDCHHSAHIYRFRDKLGGRRNWRMSHATTIGKDGKAVNMEHGKDMFYSIYSGWLLSRRSCCNCRFSCINRIADITLGDFWGLCIPDYYTEGVSLIIANNATGGRTVRNADDVYTFKASLKTAIGGNPNLFCGYKFIQYHPLMLWPDFFRAVLPHRTRLRILSNRMPYKLLWAVYKIATTCLIKVKRRLLLRRLMRDGRLAVLTEECRAGGIKYPAASAGVAPAEKKI